MHKRTETLLAKKTAWGVDLGLLCDALDFLATDYWEQRFKQLPVDEMNRRCSTETLLAKKTAWGVDLGLLCDALDFLATDYWEQRFKQLPVDEMNRRCSAKYQRPFDVSRLQPSTSAPLM